MKPRLLDLFCGAGGAAMGYHRAGFEVVGVDFERQPNYPFEVERCDAFVALEWVVAEESLGERFLYEKFDAIHASPPCQAYTTMGQRYPETQRAHERLIAEVRNLILHTRLPYVIENVLGARDALLCPIQLCSRGFGLGVGRHRLYECSFPVMSVQCQCNGSELRAARTLEEARAAMGIDWMEWDELREAIPPAHTEHVGHYLMNHLRAMEAT